MPKIYEIESKNPARVSFPPNLATRRLQAKKANFFFWLIIILIVFGIVFLASIALAYKFYATSKKVIVTDQPSGFLESIKNVATSNHKPLRGEETGRVNILLVGLAGKKYPGENLTDSIMVASLDPKNYQAAFLSIPRDLYVQIPGTNSYTKINALYARSEDEDETGRSGIEDLKHTVSEITGLDINYYIAIDFEGFKQVIDELGGVNIQVPKDIEDLRYPGPNYSYQVFKIAKGLHELDGETALKYARTRHDEGGDFGRAFRQQQILAAARQKAFSLGTLINIPAINKILDSLAEHVRSDIELDEINAFWALAEKIDTHTAVNEVLDAGQRESLLSVSHVALGGVRAYILLPRTGEYEEIRELAKNIFSRELLKKKSENIRKEEASIIVVNRSGSSSFGTRLVTLLRKLGYDSHLASAERSFSSPQDMTLIYENSKTKPFSLDDLSQKLGAEIEADLPAELQKACQSADFCLIAGTNLALAADYEEDTIKDLEDGYDKQAIDEKEYIELLKKGSNQRF